MGRIRKPNGSRELVLTNVTQQNLLGNSNDLSATGTGIGEWNEQDVVTSGVKDATDPLGRANNASSITFGLSTLVMRQNITSFPAQGEFYCFSCWVERTAGDGDFRVDIGDGDAPPIFRFDLDNHYYRYVAALPLGTGNFLDLNCPNSTVNTTFNFYNLQLNWGHTPYYYLDNPGDSSERDVVRNQLYIELGNLGAGALLT